MKLVIILLNIFVLFSCNKNELKVDKPKNIKMKNKSVIKNKSFKKLETSEYKKNKKEIKKITKKKFITKEEAIKIAEKIAEKEGYDIHEENNEYYIKRFEFLTENKLMLFIYRCYTRDKITEKWLKFCKKAFFNRMRDSNVLYKGKLEEKTWIIYYTPKPKKTPKNGTFVSLDGDFTVIIGIKTGEASRIR